MHAELGQLAQGRHGLTGVLHEHALGDLEHQRLRGQAAPVELPGDEVGEVGLLQVAHAHVDGHRYVQAAGPPVGDLGKCSAEHVPRDPVHEPGALGERDELLRRDQPPLGVAPAHQRLGPEHGAVRQADLGLVVQLEVAVVDALAQRAHRAEPRGEFGSRARS